MLREGKDVEKTFSYLERAYRASSNQVRDRIGLEGVGGWETRETQNERKG